MAMGPRVGLPFSMQEGRTRNNPKMWTSCGNRESEMRMFAAMNGFDANDLPRGGHQPHSRTKDHARKKANYEFMVADYGPGPNWRNNRPIQSHTYARGRDRDCEANNFKKFTNKNRAELQKFQHAEKFTNFTELRKKLGSDCFSHGKYDINERREVGALTTFPFLTWSDRLKDQRCGYEYPGCAGGYHHQQQAFQTSNTSYGGFVYSYKNYPDPVRQPNVYCQSGMRVVAGNAPLGSNAPSALNPRP